MQDLSQEIVQGKSTAPPSYPPPRDWACPSGNVVPEEDDQEVTFQRGGRVPTGPQLPPTSPALAGPDIGQLISTLTLGLQIGTPKISTFSGKVAPSKTEVSYEQWSHKVQCVKDHYLESVVRESIMRSLKGAAADMAHYMGPTAGVSDILEIWLFHGVKKHVRDSVRYLYSNPQTTYPKLVVAVRRAESETKETKVKAWSAAATEVPTGSKELGDQIARLMAALTRAEQNTHSASAPSSPRHRGLWEGKDRQANFCLPKLPQWSDWPGPNICSQLFSREV